MVLNPLCKPKIDPTLPVPQLKGFNKPPPISTKYKLPDKCHCPACGERLLFLPLKQADLMAGLSTGALAANAISCGCGVNGVMCIRKTPDGLVLYSMTFWIGARSPKAGVLTTGDIKTWRPPSPS